MWLERAQSDSYLEKTSLTPSRLLSPSGKKTLKHRLGSGDGSKLSKRNSLLMSPEEVKDFIEISDQLKDLLGALPTREKGDEQHMGGMKKFKLRRNRLQKTQSAGSLGSIDSIPTVPSRIQSPEGEKGVVKMSSQLRDLSLPPSRKSAKADVVRTPNKFKRSDSNLSLDTIPSLPARHFSPEGDDEIFELSGQARDFLVESLPSPLHPTKTASPAVAITAFLVGESEMDFREVVLARMPDSIKNQLSMEQWYRILEPPVHKDGKGGHSVCSDITTDDWSEEGPTQWEVEEMRPSAVRKEDATPRKESCDDEEVEETLRSLTVDCLSPVPKPIIIRTTDNSPFR